MTIQAIETSYAGCRFRSRLEARWAVFFDALGIKWEYEPQGFSVSWRLSLNEDRFNYLPDFWLPQEELWAEVKGSLTDDETVRLLNAAASLSSNDGGGCGYDNGGHDLVVLGPVPEPTRNDKQRYPIRLHMHKGDLNISRWPGEYDHGGVCVAQDNGSNIFTADYSCSFVRRILLNGVRLYEKPPWLYTLGLGNARSARFEHGART